MEPTNPKDKRQTLQEARAYLDKLAADSQCKPDFALLHRFLEALHSFLHDPGISAELLSTVARLYYASMRFEEAGEVLQRLHDPAYHKMLAEVCFLNGYCAESRAWASRQQKIWDIFGKLEAFLTWGSSQALQQLLERWDPWVPTGTLLLRSYRRWRPGILHVGCPHGIYSLVPMLYLARHAPASVLEDWHLVLEDWSLSTDSGAVGDEPIQSEDILVHITPSRFYSAAPRVNLSLWHPALRTGTNPDTALWCMNMMVRTILPLATLCLHVDEITLAESALYPEDDDVVPLSDLTEWFRSWGMEPITRPDQILERRKLAFTRRPTKVPRPRADIFQGETCMPELEEIYFLRNGRGLAAFQRYGVGNWFLTVPRRVSGLDFQTFRLRLERHVRAVLEDKVFFTGWAEGTENSYIDFLSLDSVQTLAVLQEYLTNLPMGEDIRICSFYWNAVLRTLDWEQEMEQLEHLDSTVPPKDWVSSADRSALSIAFRETVWQAASADSLPAARTLWRGWIGEEEDEDTDEDAEHETPEEDAIDWGDADWYEEDEDWEDEEASEEDEPWTEGFRDMDLDAEVDIEDTYEYGRITEPPKPPEKDPLLYWNDLLQDAEDQDEDP